MSVTASATSDTRVPKEMVGGTGVAQRQTAGSDKTPRAFKHGRAKDTTCTRNSTNETEKELDSDRTTDTSDVNDVTNGNRGSYIYSNSDSMKRTTVQRDDSKYGDYHDGGTMGKDRRDGRAKIDNKTPEDIDNESESERTVIATTKNISSDCSTRTVEIFGSKSLSQQSGRDKSSECTVDAVPPGQGGGKATRKPYRFALSKRRRTGASTHTEDSDAAQSEFDSDTPSALDKDESSDDAGGWMGRTGASTHIEDSEAEQPKFDIDTPRTLDKDDAAGDAGGWRLKGFVTSDQKREHWGTTPRIPIMFSIARNRGDKRKRVGGRPGGRRSRAKTKGTSRRLPNGQ